jgi:excisionase family DNA binding protein
LHLKVGKHRRRRLYLPRLCGGSPDKRPQRSTLLNFELQRADFLPMNDTNQQERQLVFTSSQAARYLGVSLATIRRWTDAGYIDCYRTPGAQRRFSRQQLDDFLASLQRPGNDDSSTTHRRAAA